MMEVKKKNALMTFFGFLLQFIYDYQPQTHTHTHTHTHEAQVSSKTSPKISGESYLTSFWSIGQDNNPY